MDQRTIYGRELSSRYPASRQLSSETRETWRGVLEPFLTASSTPTVLDLGCGTGRFSRLIAEGFAARVIGLDPSIDMLRNAEAWDAGSVQYAAAEAERLPLPAACCDVAWMSQVIHHIRDRGACAADLYRVLRPNGVALIRGTFGDRLDGFAALFKYFPRSRELTATFPTIANVAGIFEAERFVLEDTRRVRQQTCPSLREFAARTKLRADSTLVQLSDAEFEAGQEALEQAALGEGVPEPVFETIELLVLRKA